MNRITTLICIFLGCAFSSAQDSNDILAFRSLDVEQGLSQNSVVSIAQDSTGYIWLATQDGLNRYDGRDFKYFPQQFVDITRANYSKLGKVYVDQKGAVFSVPISGQLLKYDGASQKFNPFGTIKEVSTLIQASNSDYYIGTYGNGLYKISAESSDTLQILDKNQFQKEIYNFYEYDTAIFVAASGAVLKVTNDTILELRFNNEDDINYSDFSFVKGKGLMISSFGKGLFLFNENTEILTQFEGFSVEEQLPEDLNIEALKVDHHNRLWIATYGQGVFLVDFQKENISQFLADNTDPFALHYNDVLCLYLDHTNTIWLGTDGAGLSYYDEHLMKFKVITNKQIPQNISVDVVRAIAVDTVGTMWLGTSGKGLTSINKTNKSYHTYTQKNSKSNSDRIMSLLFVDKDLWIGHQDRGLQIREASGQFKTVSELTNQTIWKIYLDRNNQTWLCTRDKGLIKFTKDKGVIEEYNLNNSALTTNNIRTVEAGIDNQLWIGTEDNGLFVLDTQLNTIEKIDSISDKIKSLYLDKDRLWIGTNGNGLKSYDLQTKAVTSYTVEEGLPNNVIYAILPDNKGNMWLSSNKGLTRFNLDNASKQHIENYSIQSGLQAFEFNTGAYFKAANGILYFGGLDGVNWFNPDDVTYNESKPKTIISKFELFGKEHPMLPNTRFRHNQNTMTFNIAALHFSQPDQNLYRYKLVNNDSNWTKPDYAYRAHYTNLPPNEYTFLALTSNYDGVWNEVPTAFSFSILKPWYATTMALIIYFIMTLLAIFGIYKYFKWRWHMQTQLHLEHAETERLKRIDDFKTKLYTNISHEFRTPLTLISGPIGNQLSKIDLSEKDRRELDLVRQNADRLLNLVDQMLDLSLIDSGQLKFRVSKGDLSILLKQIVAAFQYKAGEKNITISPDIDDFSEAWFDRDIIEKIISNLLSNAVKYSPKGEEIVFDAKKQDGHLVVSVINENNEINQKDLGKLFQRFYQDNEASEGVGVGLALVKDLVTLSQGKILANTLEANKIQFTVSLPIEKEHYSEEYIKIQNAPATHEEEEEEDVNNDTPVLLIVEDKADVRGFIVSLFEAKFTIHEARNGQEGISLAMKTVPDLIISDVMMPVLDGNEMCKQLKLSEITSHIPIILLTAKVGEVHEITGLESGADAYITKPFNAEKLKTRVNKLIENRLKLRAHYGQEFSIHPELAVTSTENQFLKRLQETLDKHLTDPEFTSDQFSKLMFMSRTHLHRKLKANFGVSTTEFIRSQRLKLSVDLLKNSDATIAEIAYQVGFNSPSYFIKRFKEVYNCTPNDFQPK